MNRTQRHWLILILIVVSVGCAIAFAVLLGQFIHTGQRVVSAGAAPPSANGWIVLCLTALGSVLGGRWAQWLAKAAEFAPVVETTIRQIRGSKGTQGITETEGTNQTSGLAADLGDLTELVAATSAWAAKQDDKTLERRWALAALGALKDVASFESSAVANAIGLMGNAVIVECLGSPDPNSTPAGK